MLAETDAPTHPPGTASSGLGQPSLPEAPRAGAFPTQEEIEQVQLRKLRSLLQAILPSNPFYARKLAALRPPLALATLEEYKRIIPITTRHDLVRDRLTNPPYGTNLTYPLEAYRSEEHTSELQSPMY